MRILFILFLITPIALMGQNFNGFSKVTKDSVAIKWLPNDYKQFKSMLDGATIYRIESDLVSDPSTLSFGEQNLVGKINPAKSRYEKLNESIPAEDKVITLLSPFIEGSNNAEEQNFSFGLATIENVINPKFQHVVGNVFVDKNYTKGKKYCYKIEIPNSKPFYIFVNTGELTKFKSITNFNLLLDKKKTVEVSWDYQAIKAESFGFNIDHGIDDTLKYSNLLEETYLPFRSQFESKDKMADIRHDNPAEGHFHYYRVNGLDVFGQPGPKSNWKKIYVPRIIKDWVQIDSIYAEKELRIIKGFIFQEDPTKTHIEQIALLRSEEKDSNYQVMETRAYTDSLPVFKLSGKLSDDHYYYKLIAYNQDDTVSSLPYYFFVLDQEPPQTVTMLTGSVDSNGVARLSWIAPPDKDIQGYRVFRGNAKDEEFVEQTSFLSTNLSFTDTLRLDNLTSEIYYYVRAVDFNYNNSVSSDTIVLLKPDTIPPVNANLYDITLLDSIFKISWINSNSEDLKNNFLIRSIGNKVDTIYQWSDTTSYFEDRNLIPGKDYSYFIKTVDKSNNSAVSKELFKQFEPGYRKALKAKTKISIQEKLIRIEWEKPKDSVFQYVIYRAKEGEKLLPLKNIENDDQLQFEDKRVSINTKYVYSIKYINNEGIHSIPTKFEVIYQ